LDNYTILHLHSDLSNPTTTMDSVTKYYQYINKAKELGMKAICFTEHGNIMEWVHKKEECEKAGLKYIHGVEAYVTKNLNEKIRDNYHVILIALNYEGVKELNYLMSDRVAFNKEDGHFYYQPRITFDELLNTTNNIIILTACLGGILNSDDTDLKNVFIDFLKNNSHRCYLEIQHHLIEEQIKYNKYIYELSQKINVPLIIGTDTHSLNNELAEGRIILQTSKNTYFDNEQGWDLTFKSYEELVKILKKQNCMPEGAYLEAINNTNLLAEKIEEFQLDKSHKYPKIYKNSIQVFNKKIKDGIIERKIDKKENYNEYKERIKQEYLTMKNNNSIDYILLEEDIKSWCRNNNIYYGYSRGSVSGSIIAYLLNITDVDSIKYNLNFARFMNPERVSLCDIDTDYPPSQRDLVKQYIHKKENLYCAEIITFNTIAEKGAIRDVGRALNIPLEEIDVICKNIENEDLKETYRKKYPKLFQFAEMLQGVIVSVGTHPAATVVSPHPLENSIGTLTLSTCDYPVTQINMKEVDSLNYVKLDILGLDNIEIINETCKLAGIERITPDNLDTQDENIWKEIMKSGLSIFQWESDMAHNYYKKLFSQETLNKIKKINPDFKYIDLFSIGNGAIRPAGKSYREELAKGEFRDNGHQVLNDFLSSTMGYLVFQEQIIDFLHKFCGFTMGEADIVRRGFAKKTGTEEYIPRIKDRFIKTMKEKYNISEKKANELIANFLQIIEDASEYLFSLNHSDPYSRIGAACGYLRHYYTIEFLTVVLNMSENNQEKTAKIFEYINEHTNIKVKPIKFRYSKDKYTMDKSSNSIYKGCASIKHLNKQVSNELYELRDNTYNNFIELLKDIQEKTSVNSKQLDILIKLDYFSEFGKSKKLINFIKYYNEINNAKVIKKEKIEEEWLYKLISQNSRETKSQFKDLNNEEILNAIWLQIPNDDYTLREKLKFQKEFLGYINYTNNNLDKKYVIVTNLEIKYTPKLDIYCLNNGKIETIKINKKNFDYKNIKEGTVLYINSISRKCGWKKIGEHKNGKPKFEPDYDKQEWWLNSYSIVHNIDQKIKEV